MIHVLNIAVGLHAFARRDIRWSMGAIQGMSLYTRETVHIFICRVRGEECSFHALRGLALQRMLLAELLSRGL